jgi:hypothetical protein
VKTVFERVGELAVPVPDKKPELGGTVTEIHQRVAGLLGDSGSGGVGGDPGDVYPPGFVFDHDEYVDPAGKTVSTWAKSTARMAWACAVRNCFEVGPDRGGAGSILAAFKIFHTVDAATGRPSPVSSPWMCRYPQSRVLPCRLQHEDLDRLGDG